MRAVVLPRRRDDPREWTDQNVQAVGYRGRLYPTMRAVADKGEPQSVLVGQGSAANTVGAAVPGHLRTIMIDLRGVLARNAPL
jgi:hypothetical protein